MVYGWPAAVLHVLRVYFPIILLRLSSAIDYRFMCVPVSGAEGTARPISMLNISTQAI